MPVPTHTGLLTLTFTPDDPRDTTITADDGRVLYLSRSKDRADSSRTEVFNTEKTVIALLQRSDTRVHAWNVTYCQQKAEPLHKWMRTSINPLSRYVDSWCTHGCVLKAGVQEQVVQGRGRQAV